MLPDSDVEAVGETDKMTAWDNTTLKMIDTRARYFYIHLKAAGYMAIRFFMAVKHGIVTYLNKIKNEHKVRH